MSTYTLPVVSAEGLTPAAAKGKSCAWCAKRWPLWEYPVAVTAAGVLLRACEDHIPPAGEM
jgi:hypothetical protein